MPEISNADSLLIRYYSIKSPKEIAEITGIPEMDIAQRTQKLLGERNYLSEHSKVNAILFRMETLMAELEDRMADASNRDVAAIANSAAGLAGRMVAEMRKVREETKVDADAAKNQYAMELVKIVERAFDRTFGELKALYPEIEGEVLRETINNNILEIAREYDR